MRRSIAMLGLVLLCGAICLADDPDRWIPEHCLAFDQTRDTNPDASRSELLWNDAYRSGFRAIERGEYTLAETEMCRALLAARGFDPRDWRFAETLDELGLIAFQLREHDLADRMQGAAIAEMLLAAGPRGEPLETATTTDAAAMRPDCRSGIRVYLTRLGWIHERAPGLATTAVLERAPWRIFAAGYLPLDAALARRLDWLISQYLLHEELDAAEALTELQREIRHDPR